MFSTYDLKGFSKRLKEIRKSLGYTQENVVLGTGLNSETIRKLENGITIPRYDTIEVLSLFYKVDLQNVLNNYKSSKDLLKYYDLVDYFLTDDNQTSVTETITEFQDFMNNNTNNLIETKELDQLNLFFKGLALSYSDQFNRSIQEKAIDIYVEAIKACNPNYLFEDWKTYKYNYLELRILFAIASLHGFLRNCELSNELLFFILKSMDESSNAKHYDKLLMIKLFTVISYNYHRIDVHEKALDYAQKGIDYCNKYFLMANLPVLLARKGVAMYYLGIGNFETYLDQSISLLLIQNNTKLVDDYTNVFKRYRKPTT